MEKDPSQYRIYVVSLDLKRNYLASRHLHRGSATLQMQRLSQMMLIYL